MARRYQDITYVTISFVRPRGRLAVVDNGSDICPGGSATRKRGRLQIGVAFEDADATALVK
jgi:hypothetical protein